ncbi:MAG: hypothetical protein P4L46_16745, partial [Fimbriimonas sp.]|nr:hypothetical protein [Fimbriimonas sp.]
MGNLAPVLGVQMPGRQSGGRAGGEVHPAVRSLILIANTVICFGICIVAIGGLVAFFAHPALVAFLAINVLLVIVG